MQVKHDIKYKYESWNERTKSLVTAPIVSQFQFSKFKQFLYINVKFTLIIYHPDIQQIG